MKLSEGFPSHALRLLRLAHPRQNNTAAETVPSQSRNQSGSELVQLLVNQMIAPKIAVRIEPLINPYQRLRANRPTSTGRRCFKSFARTMRGKLITKCTTLRHHQTCIQSSGSTAECATVQMTLVCKAAKSRFLKKIQVTKRNPIKFIPPFFAGMYGSAVVRLHCRAPNECARFTEDRKFARGLSTTCS